MLCAPASPDFFTHWDEKKIEGAFLFLVLPSSSTFFFNTKVKDLYLPQKNQIEKMIFDTEN